MSSALARAHIAGQAHLRGLVVAGVERVWRGLPGHDRPNVDQWLSTVLPLVNAGQRQSVALTEAYLARALERPPLGLNADELVGAAVRGGTAPEEVYTRPFVTMWGALGQGKQWQDAFNAGLARAGGSAAIDVQLSMRATAGAVGQADPRIQRFQRVADDGACAFCQEVDGAILNDSAAMPLHNNCGCGIEPLTVAKPVTSPPASVAVHEHGELGPVLTSPDHDFTTESEALGH